MCLIPFGFPVDPLVYKIKSGDSESIGTGAKSPDSFAIMSCHHTSRPSTIATSCPVRLRTTTCSTVGDFLTASSTFAFSGKALPRRHPPSEVMTATASASLFRSAIASLEKPPKMTECTAPILAHANIAMTSSGVIGI